ncbi:MAG: dihydrofolate reductase [Candidatus Gracilibacteria bacterium]
MIKFSIIAAMDENRGIGKNNGLPWHLSADMKHFAVTTKGGTVIMGRKTWESLSENFRPLKERLNIVVSRGELKLPEGVELAHSLDEALEKAGSLAPERKAFVIGGATLYAEAIEHPACMELQLTELEGTLDCDAFFPEIPVGFILKEMSEEMEECGITFRFVRYLAGK